MTPKSKPKTSLSPTAYADLKKLPGNTRRQMIVAIDELDRKPRPPKSKQLTIEGETREIRRLRFGKWRIVYAVLEGMTIIIAIRKRPPYDYEDLQRLIQELD